MSSKSHIIRSKKQKMSEKRDRKGFNGTSPPFYSARIETIKQNDPHSISSDSDSLIILDHPNQPSTKPAPEAPLSLPQSQNSPPKVSPPVPPTLTPSISQPNNFNWQKLKKFQGPLTHPPKPALLEVEICDQTVNEIEQENRTINYRKAGSKNSHKTCGNFLKNRLQRIQEEQAGIEEKQKLKQIQKENAVEQEPKDPFEQKQQQTQEKPTKMHRIPRYFDQDISSSESQDEQKSFEQELKPMKCFRCGGKGHIARMCDREDSITCSFCLGGHHQSQCPDKLCRNCNKKGHIKQDCPVKSNIKCQKCYRYGHHTRNCGKVVYMNFRPENQREIRQRYQRSDLQKLKCLKCNNSNQGKGRGHFNCKQYTDKVPRVYG